MQLREVARFGQRMYMRRRRPHKLSRNTPPALHEADVNCVRAAADITNGRRVVKEGGALERRRGSRSGVQTVKVEKKSPESNIHPQVKVEVKRERHQGLTMEEVERWSDTEAKVVPRP